MAKQGSAVIYRACTLCEAICGLEITIKDNQVISIKGDRNDPFSAGHICPKATALQDIENDRNRLKFPHRKVGGKWIEIGWEEAFDLAVNKLSAISRRSGPDAVGVYLGNPNVHNYGALTHGSQFLRLLKTRNRFSATSVDQLPHQFTSHLLYGHQFLIPVPDVDHTMHMIIMGANPAVSNGSIMTAPNIRHRLKAIIKRGGKVIVIDPRRSETARLASEHHFIKPGRDVVFLLAFLKHLFDKNLVNPAHLTEYLDGFEDIHALIKQALPEHVERLTGISCATIHNMAEDFAAREAAVFYGRMGVSVTPYGALCQWLIQLINIATGNLDRRGGSMIALPAIDLVGQNLVGRGGYDRWRSRVSDQPEVCGELSSCLMAEEILTPGAGQIRAMVLVAGNPVLSTPNGRQLDRAFGSLDFMVAIDFYLNESTRHADLILPPTAPLEHDHYDLSFLALAVSNVSRFNQRAIKAGDGTLNDWEIFHQLTVRMLTKQGRDKLPKKRSPERLIAVAITRGPYGKKRGEKTALTLKKLIENPHGLYLGALQPLLTSRLKTPNGKINCTPDLLVGDLARLRQESFAALPENHLLLIGRRDIRSHNSWLHNARRLVKGKNRCSLLINPQDVKDRGFKNGDLIQVKSHSGSVTVTLEQTADIMPGVVSIPHGWGHDREGVMLDIATGHSGASLNDLTDDSCRDGLIGTAVLNATAVELFSLP